MLVVLLLLNRRLVLIWNLLALRIAVIGLLWRMSGGSTKAHLRVVVGLLLSSHRHLLLLLLESLECLLPLFHQHCLEENNTLIVSMCEK